MEGDIMDVAVAVAVILAGLALEPITRFLERREAQQLEEEWREEWALSHKDMSWKATFAGGGVPGLPPSPEPKGSQVLVCFAIIVFIVGLVTLVRFWPSIRVNEADLFFWVWLFLTMVFGMFVQVLATNYRSNLRFNVEASRLVLPLLFSIVVFYPIWGIAASGPKNFFSFYAAFLNGYFWETVVSAAKPPVAPDAQPRQ
jgi:hypothetical protein